MEENDIFIKLKSRAEIVIYINIDRLKSLMFINLYRDLIETNYI
jgi:hypothetical protein